jgi:hypothetical protein
MKFTFAAIAIAAFACAANANESSKHFSAGINISVKPDVSEAGLPLYPGAVIERDRRDDNEEGVNFNVWFGSFGMKLVVLQLKTNDSAERVEAFYRAALSARGEVLDCSRAARKWQKSDKKSDVLTCSDISIGKDAKRDGKFYKAGTRSKQYGVAIQSQGDGTTFQLLHFERRGTDE